MTRIGGGRSAAAVGVAFAISLAGGWLILNLDGAPTELDAVTPIATSSEVAILPAEPSTPAPAPTVAATPTASPRGEPGAADALPATITLAVLIDLDRRHYAVPLRRESPGTYVGFSTLSYPLTERSGVELVQVAEVGDGWHVVTVGAWDASLATAGDTDRDVTVLEFSEGPGSAMSGVVGVLRFGYRLAVTVDGGHYPLLTVRLTSPHGLRLSRPGACEGGWRWSWAEDHC